MTLLEILQTAFSFKPTVDATGVLIGLTVGQAIVIMVAAILCSLAICGTYRLTYRGAVFSRSFCLSLFSMSLIVTLLIMAIRSNIYLSLGTLGALSIIRFRTAVKEPMDMAFLFLSISMGIICGANLLGVALLGTLVLCLILIVIHFLPSSGGTYIVMATLPIENEGVVTDIVKAGTSRATLKSKSHMGDTMEITWEVSLKKSGDAFVSEMTQWTHRAVIVRSSTDYT